MRMGGRAIGQGARIVALLSLMSTGCSAGTTSGTNRTIGSADGGRDAQQPASDPEDAPPEDDAEAEEPDDAGAGEADAEADASSEADAGVAMDAAADAAIAPSDTGLDAADVDAADAAPADASEPLDAGPDAVVLPGATAPKNYLRPEDSPFAGVDFAWFYLEDFEDHQLNTPGLLSVTGPTDSTSTGVLSSSFGTGLIDSVDGDDGVPNDNRCVKIDGYCDAWWGAGSLTFRFDTQVLGALPTHVGGVWTDGEGQVSFEAFAPDGGTIYKVGPLSEPGFPDNTVSSSTGEDRFFGAYHPEGIAGFTVSNTSGGVEVDHVQYGRAR